ncbi:uncharacterized protein I303_107508 [Kwoniella dejecticola CBS 10117]|uniref:Transcription initiation factor IIF subunit beta n=1 Tax=Kwoniella dejecticola CBS 10117 TaxID=1296121 RepID=A0A1A5ZZX9_9TREE|nr:uncharacterized protein I303_06913 [Kwoniella dejecticola CBS 10117]OBR83348.1 hypothetical protein I303_06913 [Kwoniella dejecticola CBS 10117]
MSQDTKPNIQVSSYDSPSSSSQAGPSSSTEQYFPYVYNEDEELEISERKNSSSVWALKIPRFLLERWELVEEKGVELGSLIVDNSTTPAKITLRLANPDEKPSVTDRPSSGSDDPLKSRSSYDISGIPDEYTVNVPDERAKNLYVFSEKKKIYGKNTTTSVAISDADLEAEAGNTSGSKAGGKRKREKAYPKLMAKVDHECQVTPLHTAKYLKILEQRRLESEQSKRPVMHMDDTGISQAEQNQLASGYRNAISTFGSRMITSAKVNNGERHARLERHELTDRIFQLFKEKPYWGIPALKMTLKQPDGWLREVLRDVAEQIREGKYVNMWQLKRSWRGESGVGTGTGDNKQDVNLNMDVDLAEDDVKPALGGNDDENENEEDEDDDEDEEDDFEEVLA